MDGETPCPRCNAPLLAGKPFCPHCGARAQSKCPGCGQPVDPGFRFCPDCGTALRATSSGNAAPAPRGETGRAATFERLSGEMPAPLAQKVRATRGRIEGERKQVTVLFCDLVGSASIAEGMDPEDYRDLLDRYLAVAFEQVYRFEGVVNQIAGDGVMALFGAPIAHEDAPARACHAALAIRDGVRRLSETLRAERAIVMQVRIGINTGPVIVGTVGNDLKMDYTAIGDTTNLASRLQTLAEADGILISEATHRLVRTAFTFRPLGEMTIRGKSTPVDTYELLAAAGVETAAAARASSLIPFVGREEELRILGELFEQAAAGRGQVAGIVGDAGLGKTRLLHEFGAGLGGRARTLEGECFSYSRGVPYDPFVRLLRRHLGIDQTVDADACRCLAAAVEPWDPDLTSAFPVLCHMLGMKPEAAPTAAGTEMQWAAFDAMARLILAEAETLPVIVILEDIQWMDEASAELLASLVSRLHTARVLILCAYRPEHHPPWSRRPNVTEIGLAPLTAAQSEALIAAMLGGPPPPQLLDAVIRKAEGNPFFTEEVTRSLLEEGVVLQTPEGPVLTRDLEQIDVPVTVHEIVAARLDRLPAAAKRFVQVASVIGRQFRVDLLAEMLAPEGIEVAAQISTLEQSEIIRPKDALGRDEYVFRHALTQEVAYQGLLVRQRRQLHEAIGLALERRVGTDGSPGDTSALLALHFRLGENHQKAVEYTLQAAERAEAAPSYGSAVELYRQTWELARGGPDADALAPQALRAGLSMLGILAFLGEGRQITVDTLIGEVNRLIERIGTVTDRIAAASYTGVILMMAAAEQFETGLAHLERALSLAERERDDVWRWRILRSLTLAYVFDGRNDDASVTADRVLTEVTAAGTERTGPDVQLGARLLRDVVSVYRDDFDRARIESEGTFRLAAEYRNRTMRVISAGLVATVDLLRGEFASAREWATRGLVLAEEIGSGASVPNLAAIVLLANEAEGTDTDPEPYVAQIEANISTVAGAQQVLRFVVDALIATGDLDRAERIAQTVRRRSGGRFRKAYSAKGLADIAARRGAEGWSRAGYFYEEAVRVAREIDAQSLLASALLAQAHLFGLQGKAEAGIAALDEGMRLARGLGMRWLLAQGERLRERLVAGPTAGPPSQP